MVVAQGLPSVPLNDHAHVAAGGDRAAPAPAMYELAWRAASRILRLASAGAISGIAAAVIISRIIITTSNSSSVTARRDRRGPRTACCKPVDKCVAFIVAVTSA